MAATTTNRKRPRLDMNTDARERKRGKSMFGLVLGTLNKAKNEDKERNASEAVSVWFGCWAYPPWVPCNESIRLLTCSSFPRRRSVR